MSKPAPTDDSSTPLTHGTERHALQILALAALVVIVRLMLPLGVGLLIGALLAFVLQPFYERLKGKSGLKPVPAALICTLGSTLLIGGAIFGLGYLVVSQGAALAASIPQQFSPGGSFHDLTERGSALFKTFHIDPSELAGKVREASMALGTKAATFAATIAGATFEGLLTLLFFSLTNYYVLVHWNALVTFAERDLPLRPAHTRALLEEFRKVGSQVLFGTVSTGLIQGFLAAIGYWITGVEKPALFGAVTAVASLIPAVGTVIVWGGIGVFRLATGHVGAGIAELVYGAVVVGVVTDYVIRPRLVGRDDGVPTLLTFVGLLGGTAVFGLIGLILGPVIVSMCVAILRIYDEAAAANPRIQRDPDGL